MKATLLHRSRVAFGLGFIEMVIWHVPRPLSPSTHPYKYRLVYIVNGQRLIGYDNERGKGDHKHHKGIELPYSFTGPDQLIADFLADIEGITP